MYVLYVSLNLFVVERCCSFGSFLLLFLFSLWHKNVKHNARRVETKAKRFLTWVAIWWEIFMLCSINALMGIASAQSLLWSFFSQP